VTGTLEFPYRMKRKVVVGLIVFLVVCLAALAGLVYFWVAGLLTSNDFQGRSGGKLLIAIPIDAAAAVLVMMYLGRMRGAVVRLTNADLCVGKIRPSNTLPVREIQKIDVRPSGTGIFRVMYVHALTGRWLMIEESMLPSSQAFDQIQQGLLGSRPGWQHAGTTWSVK
jgi:hypothetical protein